MITHESKKFPVLLGSKLVNVATIISMWPCKKILQINKRSPTFIRQTRVVLHDIPKKFIALNDCVCIVLNQIVQCAIYYKEFIEMHCILIGMLIVKKDSAFTQVCMALYLLPLAWRIEYDCTLLNPFETKGWFSLLSTRGALLCPPKVWQFYRKFHSLVSIFDTYM